MTNSISAEKPDADTAGLAAHQANQMLLFLYERVSDLKNPIPPEHLSTMVDVIQDKVKFALTFIDSLDVQAVAPEGGRHAA